MKTLKTTLVMACTGLAATILTAAALSGPLEPPAGAVASSYKTLSDVEPRVAINSVNTPGDADSLYRIAQPGSYYLTANAVGVAGKSVIEIAASNVTLDLNGFTIRGVPTSVHGVNALVVANVTVRNGSVRDCPSTGVNMTTVSWGRVESLWVALSGTGIAMANGGVLLKCVVDDCTADGIVAGNQTLLDGCTSRGNDGDGIRTLDDGTVRDCVASHNGGAGISLGLGGRVTGSNANFNIGDGISAGTQSHIDQCSATQNAGDGIQVVSFCRVSRCTCTGNGTGAAPFSAGIRMTSFNSRVDDNIVGTNDIGILAEIPGNFVSRNTASNNNAAGNYVLVAGNVCLVVNSAAAPAISGSSGGTSPGSSDPNANYSY